MLTQAIPPGQQQPYKYFGSQGSASMPPSAINFTTQRMPMMPPRLPMPNMYAQFNQYKQINVPPPNITVPPPTVTDPNSQQAPPPFFQSHISLELEARRQQRKTQRRTVDYNASIVQHIKNRIWKKTSSSEPPIQPDVLYYADLASPGTILENPVNAVATRFVKTATNKIRCPIFCLSWTPEGRRLITGSSSGEFTLWGGLAFNFETVLQAHENAVRAMEWSHNDTWLLSADHAGCVKYWQSNMNNVKTLQAHTDPVRGVGFSPTDNKFATCSDDGTVKIWDFYRCQEERVLRGHGADVKCLGWHPAKGLLVSGSKDSQQPLKLWDPKSGSSLSTIHLHKSTVMDLQWNRNGNWLLTASRDHLIKVFDIRAMKEIQAFRGHKKEATAVDWHPVHESLFSSGGSDGAILFWDMGSSKEVGSMDHAHDTMIWSVRWHPLGHILASGSNDHTCKFWTRNRPGDKMKDKYNLNTNPLGDDDYEYDIPTANDSAMEHNSFDLNTSSAQESVPGLAMGVSTASSSSLPVPTAEGIPGIDMQFPSADKIKEQQDAKQKQLQTARQSGFKLPIRQVGSNGEKLNVDADEFIPRTASNNSAFGSSSSSSTLGLLPTPDRSQMITPKPESKGIFDPMTIQPGFVIDAQEIWINEKFSSDDSQQSDNKFKKRIRKPDIMQRNRYHSEDPGAERGMQHNEEEYKEFHDEQTEPPEKRQTVQHSLQQGMFGPRHADDSSKSHSSLMQYGGRNQGNPNNYPPFKPPIPFHPHSGTQEEHSVNIGADDDNFKEWNDSQGYTSSNHRNMPGTRGRGRGFAHTSMRRDPSMQRDSQYFVDEEGKKVPIEQHGEQQWRTRGRQDSNAFDEQEEDGDWNNPNYMPHKRRGPHPLLLRGHPSLGQRRFPPPGEGRGIHFDGNGPPVRQGQPQRPPHPRFPSHESQDMPHLSEQTRATNSRAYPKLRGLMDGPSRPSNESWQSDRTGMGR